MLMRTGNYVLLILYAVVLLAACADSSAIGGPTDAGDAEAGSLSEGGFVLADAGQFDGTITGDAAADSAGPTRWCDSLADAGAQAVFYCADFDDGMMGETGSYPNVGSRAPTTSSASSLVVDNSASLSSSYSLVATTAAVLATDSGAPPDGAAVDYISGIAQIRGYDEPVFRAVGMQLSLRNEAASPPEPNADPALLMGAQYGWFDVTLLAVPDVTGALTLSLRLKSFWKGDVADGSDLGENDDFIRDIPIATPPIPFGEWVTCTLKTEFTPRPGGDASAHVELNLARASQPPLTVAYDHPSTRFRYTIVWVMGLQTYIGYAPMRLRFDNMAFYRL